MLSWLIPFWALIYTTTRDQAVTREILNVVRSGTVFDDCSFIRVRIACTAAPPFITHARLVDSRYSGKGRRFVWLFLSVSLCVQVFPQDVPKGNEADVAKFGTQDDLRPGDYYF